ncbi:MAG: SBBP repeat-containing protein [Deltaproteobacteria bacterium]|nr:SBBP repeat-containing protein [Deltaproteobacteria bacterium]
MNFLSSNRKCFSRLFKLSKLFFVLCLTTFVLVGFSPGGNEAALHDTLTALDETHGGILPPGPILGPAGIQPLASLPSLTGAGVPKASPGNPAVAESQKLRAQEFFSKLPLSFIENRGQMDKRVRFYQKSPGQAISFTKDGIFFALLKGEGRPRKDSGEAGVDNRTQKSRQPAQVSLIPLRMQPGVEIVPLGPQPGKIHYYRGGASPQAQTDIPTYGAVLYRQAYPGIDLKFYGADRTLEYDIIVQPGADPSQVRFGYHGIKSLKLSPEGDLLIHLPQGGHLVQKHPVIYQEIAGHRVAREGRFQVHRNGARAEYGIQVASYDRHYPVIIDPVLSYSTYLGGSGTDAGNAIAVDQAGNMYVTGYTTSGNFPLLNPAQQRKLDDDVFVTKFDGNGSLAYSTYLSGNEDDVGHAIAVDGSGNAYVTGTTKSWDFYVSSNAFQTSFMGGSDAFVVKLDPNGQIAWSSFLGGLGDEEGLSIAVDVYGKPYVTGYTKSSNFPTAGSPFQSFKAGNADVFITKFKADGTGLEYSTYLGGGQTDTGYCIALNAAGEAYVGGYTTSNNFPPLYSVQQMYTGWETNGRLGFVTRLNAQGSALVYSTYLGGNGDNRVNGIAVDANDDAYVTGYTSSSAFPTQNPLQSQNGGYYDAFVAKIHFVSPLFAPLLDLVNVSPLTLSYSTYLGGGGNDYGNAIAVDTAGNAYITGSTFSANFPLNDPIQSGLSGSSDAFVAKINPDGSALQYSTYLGGSNADVGQGIAVSPDGNDVYVTGSTSSSVNFPLAKATFPTYGGGSSDAFLARLSTRNNVITASATGNGTISPSGEVPVNYGADQNFTIKPDDGYHVADVLVDGSSVGAVTSYLFTKVTSGHTISATFAIDTFTITANAGDGGAISPSGTVSAAYGSTPTFTISPNIGYHIVDVVLDGTTSLGPVSSYQFTSVSADHSITASFAINTYSINASVSGTGGTISPFGTVSADYGSTPTFTITPNTGYHIVDVVLDGTTSLGPVSSYQFTGVSADHSITASFTIDTFTIAASAGSNGAISPAGTVTKDYGTNQAYTITPAANYHVADVLVDGVSVGAVTSFTFTAVAANHTISASFTIDTFTIAASAGSNGAISPAGTVTKDYGSSQAYTITPAANYHVADVLVDGVSVGAKTSFTFTAIAANHTISASFTIHQRQLYH